MTAEWRQVTVVVSDARNPGIPTASSDSLDEDIIPDSADDSQSAALGTRGEILTINRIAPITNAFES